MSTQSPVSLPPTFEQRMQLAAAEAAQVANIFSPAIGQAIQASVSIEPVISGFIKMMIDLFHHHAKQSVLETQAPSA